MSESKYEDGLPDLRPGEPFFFLRAQDVLAPFAVLAYAAQLRAAAAGVAHGSGGALPTIVARVEHLRVMADECEHVAARMLVWQAAHKTKLPD